MLLVHTRRFPCFGKKYWETIVQKIVMETAPMLQSNAIPISVNL